MLICIECRRTFVDLEDALRHISPISKVKYNAAAPGRPRQVKVVEVHVPTRKHVVFPVRA